MKNQPNPINEVLYRLNVGSKIDVKLLEDAFDIILSNKPSSETHIQLGSILTGIMSRGPTEEEIIALLKSVFKLDNFCPEKRRTIELPKGEKLIGMIGSGKKGIKTMNISTPALLTAASIGVYTSKTVSHSTSSLTGSADFLEKVGCNLNIPIDEMKDIILKIKFGAFKIENLLPKFNSIYGQKFIAPHALSFGLAALASPIKYDNFLYGLAHPNVELSANVLKSFKIENIMIASTTHDKIHYLDEMGIYGETRLIGIQKGKLGELKIWNPLKELKLPSYLPHHISEGNNVTENIKLSLDVLKGKGEGAREDIIAINAGTILYLAGMVSGLEDGYKMSKEAIKKGLPYKKLIEFIESTGGNINKIKEFE